MGGKNSREGIVEICINNLWGRVCTIDWDTRAANVTCRHAGFSSQGNIYVCVCVFLFLITNILTDVIHKFVYNTSLSVHSAKFNCRGNERSLLDCEIQSSYCFRYSALHVTCLS